MAHVANLRISTSANVIALKVELYDENPGETFFMAGSRHVFNIDRSTGAVIKTADRSERETIALHQCLTCAKVRRMVQKLMVAA